MGLADYAAEWRELAERAEVELAVTAVRAGAKELLAAMEIVTPVLSGDLRASEKIQDVSGDGSHAVALVGPDGSVIYDEFRNDGGTITADGDWPLRNKDTGQVFSRRGGSVTQQGAHYMERAEEEGRPMVESAMQGAVQEFFTL